MVASQVILETVFRVAGGPDVYGEGGHLKRVGSLLTLKYLVLSLARIITMFREEI